MTITLDALLRPKDLDDAGTVDWTATYLLADKAGWALPRRARLTNIFPVGKTVFVDATNGSDSTGARGYLGLPFLTLAAAQSAATSGDTVIVHNGSYTTAVLGSKALTWHFMPSTTITGASGQNIFTVSTNIAVTITGFGVFVAASGQPCILQSGTTSVMDIEARSFTGTSTVVLDFAQGTTTVRNAYILNSGASGNVVTPDGPDNRVRLINCDIRNPSSSAAAIRQDNSGSVLTLQNCVIVTGATNSFSSPSTSNVKIYNGTVSNKAADVDTTFIVGSLTVDTDVS